VKHDVLPMRYTSVNFEPTKKGVYHLFCAEYCGTEHSRMVGRVFVMEQAEYEAWLASPIIEGGVARDALPIQAGAAALAAAPTANANEPGAKGKALLESKGCRVCHQPGNTTLAPALEGIFGHTVELVSGQKVKVDANYLRESILSSQAKIVKGYGPPSAMPPYQGIVSEDEIKLVIDYIKSTSGSTK